MIAQHFFYAIIANIRWFHLGAIKYSAGVIVAFGKHRYVFLLGDILGLDLQGHGGCLCLVIIWDTDKNFPQVVVPSYPQSIRTLTVLPPISCPHQTVTFLPGTCLHSRYGLTIKLSEHWYKTINGQFCLSSVMDRGDPHKHIILSRFLNTNSFCQLFMMHPQDIRYLRSHCGDYSYP